MDIRTKYITPAIVSAGWVPFLRCVKNIKSQTVELSLVGRRANVRLR